MAAGCLHSRDESVPLPVCSLLTAVWSRLPGGACCAVESWMTSGGDFKPMRGLRAGCVCFLLYITRESGRNVQCNDIMII